MECICLLLCLMKKMGIELGLNDNCLIGCLLSLIEGLECLGLKVEEEAGGKSCLRFLLIVNASLCLCFGFISGGLIVSYGSQILLLLTFFYV